MGEEAKSRRMPRLPQVAGMANSPKDAALFPLLGPSYPNESPGCHTLQPLEHPRDARPKPTNETARAHAH